MPLFFQANIPAKNVTWLQFIALDYTGVDALGTSVASYTVPAGKIAQVLELINTHGTNWGTTQPKYNVVVDIGGLGTNNQLIVQNLLPTTTTSVVSRQTVMNAGDILRVKIAIAAVGTAGEDWLLLSGQFAD